jgi:hypothetical protein
MRSGCHLGASSFRWRGAITAIEAALSCFGWGTPGGADVTVEAARAVKRSIAVRLMKKIELNSCNISLFRVS